MTNYDASGGNLFADLPASIAEELVDVFAHSQHVRVERIVSTGHASPEDSWYDQDEHEWVVVLKGEGKLLFEADDGPILLRPGDYVLIPAHRKHRVEWTVPGEPTVWLAVFFQE